MADAPARRRLRSWITLAGLLVLPCLLTLSACTKKPADPEALRAAFLPTRNPFAGVPKVPGMGMDDSQPLGNPAPEPVRSVVRFPSNDADLFQGQATIIEAELYRPAGPGPFPAVVALHDCMGLYGPSGKVNSHMRDWAERLAAQGYAVLMPDSFNPRGVPEDCDKDQSMIRPGVERARDAAAAFDWLQVQSWADGARVGLMGWANGGTTALTFATSDGRLRRHFTNRDFRLIVAFYPNCAVLSRAPAWRADLPLAILIGGNDNWAPAEDCVALARQVESSGGALDLVKYYGAAHDFDWPGMPLHVKAGLTMTATGSATIGTDSQARADSVARVTRLLAITLHP
jgi:dienelactone hydrolase